MEDRRQPDDDPCWYALYTRSRHEKRVDAALRERSFEAYLPLVARLRQWHDRKKVIEFPMFPSYVFARTSLRDLPAALSTPGVATVIRFDGRPVAISSEEMANVRRFAEALGEAGTDAHLCPLVSVGQRVRVVSGPFAGVEGTVLEQRARRATIQVGIGAIQQALRVELPVESIELLGSSQAVGR